MISALKEMDIQFDSNDNITISKQNLLLLIQRANTLTLYSEKESLPTESFVLIDKNSKDLYPFSKNEIEEWETDGSCEKGDRLYKLEFLKEY